MLRQKKNYHNLSQFMIHAEMSGDNFITILNISLSIDIISYITAGTFKGRGNQDILIDQDFTL